MTEMACMDVCVQYARKYTAANIKTANTVDRRTCIV